MTPSVVLVTDPRYPIAHIERVIGAAADAIGPGLLVQVRDKVASPRALVLLARRFGAVARPRGARVVINMIKLINTIDSINVVNAINVDDGVHVPGGGSIAAARRALGPAALVTAAAHDDGDVRRAIAEGASAVLVSPIFASPGKGAPRGVGALAGARAVVDAAGASLAIYALGGVTPRDAASCRSAGADGVAVIRALLDAGDDAGRVARALAAPFGAPPRP